MLSYCSKCRKTTKGKIPRQFPKANTGKLILLSKYTAYNTKTPKFIKIQEASRLLSSLGIKTPLIESQD